MCILFIWNNEKNVNGLQARTNILNEQCSTSPKSNTTKPSKTTNIFRTDGYVSYWLREVACKNFRRKSGYIFSYPEYNPE